MALITRSKCSAKKSVAKRSFIFALIPMLLIASFLMFLAGCGDNEETPRQREIRALTYAQIAVREQLVSPGTAEFPSTRDATITLDEESDQYTVQSFVDSQNALGATLRTRFVVVVELVDRERHRIISVDLN